VLSLIFSLSIPFIPVTQHKSTLYADSESPKIDLPNGLTGIEFPVTRQKVEELAITFEAYCQFPHSNKGLLPVFQTSLGNTGKNYLQVKAVAEKIVVLEGERVAYENAICSTQNNSPLVFQLQKANLIITQSDLLETVKLESEPFFSILALNSDIFSSKMFSATIQSYTHSTTPGIFGSLIRVLTFIFLVFAFVSLTQQKKTGLGKFPQFPSVSPIHIAVFLSLASWALVGTPLFDDGWFTQIFTNSEKFNFYNIYNVYDGRFPTGSIWFIGQSVWNSLSTNLFWARLSGVLLTYASWVLLLKSAKKFITVSFSSLVIGSAFFLAGAFGFLISNRPEAFVVFLISLIIFLLSSVNSINIHQNLFLAGLICGLCVSTHLSGIVSFAVIFAWLIIERDNYLQHSTFVSRIFLLALPLATCSIAFIFNLFLLTNYKDLTETRSLWYSVSSIIPDWRVRVWGRFIEVFSSNPSDNSVRRLFCIGVVLCIPLFGWIPKKTPQLKWLFMSLIFGLFILSAVPSIGVWQLGVFTPFIFILVLAISSSLKASQSAISYALLSLFIAFLGILIWSSDNLSYFDLRSDVEMDDVLTHIMSSTLFWLVFPILVLLLTPIYPRVVRRVSHPIQTASFTLLLACLLGSVYFQLGLSGYKRVSEQKINSSSQGSYWFPGQSNCGLSSVSEVPDYLNPSVAQIDSVQSLTSSKTTRVLGKNITVFALSKNSSLDFVLPEGQDYVLLYGKNSSAEGFSLLVSSITNPDVFQEAIFPGINIKSPEGFSPFLMKFSDIQIFQGSGRSFRITSNPYEVFVASPMTLSSTSADSFDKPIYQISSELQPFYLCLEESHFSQGLSTDPVFLIGQLPSFPHSPAAVFDDYLDSVDFIFDPERGTMGRLFLRN
jgi:hypothetical protein